MFLNSSHSVCCKSIFRVYIEIHKTQDRDTGMRIKTDTDMTRGNIWLQILRFSVPMALGLLFQQLYSTVDALVVGQFVGKHALAAVGCNSPIINTIVGTFAGLATGASVIISQSFGAHDDERLSRAVHTTMGVTFILCGAGTAIGLIAARPLLNLTNTDPDVMDDALTYLRIYFAGVSGLLVYNMGTGILRAVGDSARPVLFLVISAVINTALDLVFVLVLKRGVDGVAYATIISQFISAVMVLTVLMKTDRPYRFTLSGLRIHRDILRRMLALGLPTSVQSAVTSFSNVFVQAYINSLRADGMAGWTAYTRLDAFLVVPVQAIAMASTTFVGQCWGADLKERAREGVNRALTLCLGITVFLSAMVMVFSRPLLGLFVKAEEAEVLEYGQFFVTVITPFYFTISFNQIYAGALRGIGNTAAPTVIMLSSFVVFRQIFLFIFTRVFPGDRLVIALAYPMGWVLCSALLVVFYRKSQLFAQDQK